MDQRYGQTCLKSKKGAAPASNAPQHVRIKLEKAEKQRSYLYNVEIFFSDKSIVQTGSTNTILWAKLRLTILGSKHSKRFENTLIVRLQKMRKNQIYDRKQRK